MKKTIITLLAMVGVATADELTPVWSKSDIDVSGNNNYPITLTDTTLNTEIGYTAVITLNWTTVSNAPMFWLGTAADNNYKSSTATFGYDKNDNHACLFDTGNGSNANNTDSSGLSNIKSSLQDYIEGGINNEGTGSKAGNLANKTLTFFITSQAGTATLYSLTNKNEVVSIVTQSGMAQGSVTTLHVGHWSTDDNTHDGTMSIALYNSVMTQDTMQSIAGAVIPEPTTATLSLLALCGLAARRRRK